MHAVTSLAHRFRQWCARLTARALLALAGRLDRYARRLQAASPASADTGDRHSRPPVERHR
ncbi:MAG: hypothetical protein HY784_11980 [Chloroflexi bacterium]|nr:hypothetical protein [Chloroflexota bacterium]